MCNCDRDGGLCSMEAIPVGLPPAEHRANDRSYMLRCEAKKKKSKVTGFITDTQSAEEEAVLTESTRKGSLEGWYSHWKMAWSWRVRGKEQVMV